MGRRHEGQSRVTHEPRKVKRCVCTQYRRAEVEARWNALGGGGGQGKLSGTTHLDGPPVAHTIFPRNFMFRTGVLRSVLPVIVLLVALPVAAGGGHRGGRRTRQ
jgi:hypothetical protein